MVALYSLGQVPWSVSQLLYHSLAELGREALVLVWPAEPYVSVGFHQDARQELDLDYCRMAGLPVFRREVGGGTVYLDSRQVFWQLILKKNRPDVPLDRRRFYEKYMFPVVAAYRAMGLAAEYRAMGDIVVGQRKVTGSGAGEVGSCVVLVGNILREFDCSIMARVLRCPDQWFRTRLQITLESNLSSVCLENGRLLATEWGPERLCRCLAEQFAVTLGPLEPAGVDAELSRTMDDLGQTMLSDGWLKFKRPSPPGRVIKIRAGVYLHYRELNSPHGGLRVIFQTEDLRLHGVTFYEVQPADQQPSLDILGNRLEAVPVNEAAYTVHEWIASQKTDFEKWNPGELATIFTSLNH